MQDLTPEHAHGFRVCRVDWNTHQSRIMMIRNSVFIEEQGVSPDEEQDGLDEECLFVLAEDLQGHPIGTARLLPGGKIGRLAVLEQHRHRGVGSALLKAVMAIAAEEGLSSVYLHGQVHARQFYRKHGFVETGPVFEEAGIPHLKMRRDLPRH